MKSINKEELHSLFIGIANKEEEKFNILYKKYHTLVYGIAFSIAKNKENSEDITQMVFHKIWNMSKHNLPESGEASWLYTLTKNETINFLKKEKPTLDIEELTYIASEEDEIDELIEREHYNKIISKLNKKEQEIISLKILSKLSFRQIAQVLNMPIATVQWKYYKSLHTLKLLLSNLTIFIIAIGLFIVNKTMLESKNGHDSTTTEETKEDIKDENNITGDADSSIMDREDTEKDMLDGIVDNKNNTTNEIIEDISIENDNSFSNIDIGLLSIAGIFLTLAIIFSIIFTKHQQKQKEKLSK